MIRFCEMLAPTVGGINLEDIKAPECFEVEQTLRDRLDIPVFHDDQHGTAIIGGAAFLNALELTGRDISRVKVVFAGAGAAGIASARFFIELGMSPENILMVDSIGVIHNGRDDLNDIKREFAVETDARTLEDALVGADAFIGVSIAGTVTKEMVQTMAERPIVFALANPDPEISYADALAARPDVVMATGRSDYPNQVNNVLGFPFIFRGALDVRARGVSEGMKIAAVHALAELAKEPVPDSVLRAYDLDRLQFGPEYLIPKPFDPTGSLAGRAGGGQGGHGRGSGPGAHRRFRRVHLPAPDQVQRLARADQCHHHQGDGAAEEDRLPACRRRAHDPGGTEGDR